MTVFIDSSVLIDDLRGGRDPVVEYQALDDEFVREAYVLAWKLDRDRVVIPLPDLLIATAARRRGATVVTTDPHVASVPGLAIRPRLAL